MGKMKELGLLDCEDRQSIEENFERIKKSGSGGGGLPSDLVETVPDIVELVFDGTLDGKEYKEFSMDEMAGYFVKMSSDVPTLDNLLTLKVLHPAYGEQNIDITAENISDIANTEGAITALVDMIYICSEDAAATPFGVNIDKGVWFILVDASIMGGTGWMGGLGLTYDSGERTQIKPEFMPYDEIIEKVLEAIPSAKGVSF